MPGCIIRHSMVLRSEYKPEFESLRDKLLEIAQVRDVGDLVGRVVETLGQRPHVALARVWLIGPGDVCSTCQLMARCANQDKCLRLVASAGARNSEWRPEWSRL